MVHTRNPKGEPADSERRHPQWWQLSLATDTEFIGAVIVYAHGLQTAIARAQKLGIKLTSEVMGWPIRRRDTPRIPPDMRNRLIPPEEFRRRLDGKRANR